MGRWWWASRRNWLSQSHGKGTLLQPHASKTLGAGALAEPSPSAESPPVVSDAPDKV